MDRLLLQMYENAQCILNFRLKHNSKACTARLSFRAIYAVVFFPGHYCNRNTDVKVDKTRWRCAWLQGQNEMKWYPQRIRLHIIHYDVTLSKLPLINDLRDPHAAKLFR